MTFKWRTVTSSYHWWTIEVHMWGNPWQTLFMNYESKFGLRWSECDEILMNIDFLEKFHWKWTTPNVAFFQSFVKKWRLRQRFFFEFFPNFLEEDHWSCLFIKKWFWKKKYKSNFECKVILLWKKSIELKSA